MKSLFLLFLTSALCLAQTPPADPAWWSEGNPPVIVPGAVPNNKGPANIGQAKYMAKRALEALQAIHAPTAALIEADLVGAGKPIPTFDVPVNPNPQWLESQKAALLVGQLKAIAAPFYTHLHNAAPTWLEAERTTNGTNTPNSIFPWTTDTNDDQNKTMATIGQLKAVFALRVQSDSDNDNLSDLFEWIVNGGLSTSSYPANVAAWLIATDSSYNPNADYDGDGMTNALEVTLGTDLLNMDTDGDGIADNLDSLPLAPNGTLLTATELRILTTLE